MKKILFISILSIIASYKITAQNPKLVVGIVIDQMRYDYIYKFWDKYSENGFKKLATKGFVCHNTKYNYVPTFTGPGHASIYTGSTPAFHGIIANNWFNKFNNKMIYCVEDNAVKTVGSLSDAGKMSPKNLISTTITDQLKLATNFKSKVIGISLKDRGAILPAGHFADAAYWFDGENTGKFVSSTYYLDNLPDWVIDFNNQKLPDQYLSKTWSTYFPIEEYNLICDNDDNPYEGTFKGKKKPIFPYVLSDLAKFNNKYDILKATPFGNTLVKELAKSAISGEKLGFDNITDFLTISFSSTDYIGHLFGPQSIELADTYIRLDLEIADLINFLEEKIGKENFILFLTADHAAAYPPKYLNEHKYAVNNLSEKQVFETINAKLKEKYHIDSLILSAYNQQIYVDKEKTSKLNLDFEDLTNNIKDELLEFSGIYKVFTAEELVESNNNPLVQKLNLGYNQKLSGDIIYILNPGWLSTSHTTGTTHGSPYNYDTHVPLIFYGKNIPSNETYIPINITDIAPTIAAMLKIQEPNASIGKPIIPLLMKN
jgi:predicted AlkP superfamily pyrophosphatase or phosphodiesterase